MSRKSSRRQAAAATVEPPEPPVPVTRSHDVAKVKDDDAEDMSPDKVAELWAEFAGDHYEIVEQLPLELHRNSRLLRELDAESLSQQERLQAKIRDYIAYRIELVRPKTKAFEVDEKPGSGDRNEGLLATKSSLERQGSAVDGDVPRASVKPDADVDDLADAGAPTDALSDGRAGTQDTDKAGPNTHAEDIGDTQAADADITVAVTAAPTQDGAAVEVTETPVASGTDAGGLPTEATGAATATSIEQPVSADDLEPKKEPVTDTPAAGATPAPQSRSGHEEPHVDEDHATEAVDAFLDAADVRDSRLSGERLAPRPSVTPSTTATHAPRPKRFALGDISSLISELVRNREEKVAIAVGAYNTIDRHIRALDSALSAQETSFLGLAGTEPPPEPVEPEPAPPHKGRKDKRKRKSSELATPATRPGELPPGIEADPNEPRYCYCNQVSYGEMVGCDNDDCPYEWFHLSCLGLTAPPAGDFLCDACRPDKDHTAPQRKKRKR